MLKNLKDITTIFSLFTASIIIGFLIVELISRVVFHVQLPQYVDRNGNPYRFLIPDAEVHHKNKENFNGKLVATEFEHRVRTNSMGFRGLKEFFEEKNGKYRIFGLGDSFTFGYGVEEDETYLSRLEQMLNDTLSFPVEIVNLGVEATGTLQQIKLFRRFSHLKPDLVILGFFARDVVAATGGNDLVDNYTHFGWASRGAKDRLGKVVQKKESIVRKTRNFLRKHSNLYRIIELYFGGYLRKNYAPENNPELYEKAWQITREALTGFDRELETLNLKCILFWIPFPTAVAKEDSSVGKKLEELGLKNIVLANPLKAFNRNPGNYYYKADCHWNSNGHRVGADLLFETIVNHGLIQLQ